jgi:hypothetical protein
LLSFSFNGHRLYINEDSFRHAGKELGDGINLVLMLFVEFRKGRKFEIVWTCPVEGLVRELPFIWVGDSHSDIVVSVQSIDFTPEEKLLNFILLAVVQ